MKFVTHKIAINGSKKPSIDALLAKIASAKPGSGAGHTKTASVAEPVSKEANIKNLGDFAHPKGGKKPAPKKDEQGVAKEASKDDMPQFIKDKIEGKDSEKKDEGKKDDKKPAFLKDKKEASAPAAVKVAEDAKNVEKYDAGKLEAKNFTNDADKKPQDGSKPEKEAGKAATTTTKTQDGTFPSSGQTQWEGKAENNNKPEMPNDKNTTASADALLKDVLAFLDGVSMTKTANLKPEEKKKVKAYWAQIYEADFADAMVADR